LDFLSAQGGRSGGIIKVAVVSSWFPRKCGIAVYSFDLAKGLKRKNIDIEIICHTGVDPSSHIHPVLNMKYSNWPDELFLELKKISPDVVHIEHEYGLYTLNKDTFFDFSPANSFALADTLFKLKIANIPVVITYHSIYSKMTNEEIEYLKIMTDLSTATIVHEPFQKSAIAGYLKNDSKIFTVPHGTWAGSIIQKNLAKVKQDWEGKFVVGMIGFLEKTKGFERIIKLWSKVVEKTPNALLVIQGNARPGSPTGPIAKHDILNLINKSRATNSIEFYDQYFTWPENNSFISGFDLMVLPYDYASQSGNLAHAYGAGLPVVASDLEGIGSSVRTSKAGILAKSDAQFLNAIIKLAKNNNLRKKYAENSKNYSKKIDWDRVAEKHIEVYHWAIDKVKHSKKLNDLKYINSRTHV